MSPKVLTDSQLKNIRKEARKIQDQSGITFRKARLISIHRAGFSSEKHLDSEKRVKEFFKNITHGDYRSTVNEIHKRQDQIFKSHNDFSHNNFPSNINMIEECIDVLKNGFDAQFQNRYQDPAWYRQRSVIFSFGIRGYLLKDLGNSLKSNHETSGLYIGYILLAMGGFFSSIQYAFKKQGKIHCNFEAYMSEWIEMFVKNKEHFEYLRKVFPATDLPRAMTQGAVWLGFLGSQELENRKARHQELLEHFRIQNAKEEELERIASENRDPNTPFLIDL